MEVFVCEPFSQFCNATFPLQARVGDLIDRYLNQRGFEPADFYVKENGRLSGPGEELQAGAVYRLEPRLRGGKGGFGSMLRALGAQIEKTTNREACRDLSGRRLRDVNHEKEMAEWLKKQADRDAEKEQRRQERLQRKLAEPRHHFTDPTYEQQCHDLSERLEDSVLKGMQASSSGLVQVEETPSRKRPITNKAPKAGKKKCYWTGVDGMDDLGSSEDDDSEDGSGDDSYTSSTLGGPHPEAAGTSASLGRPHPEAASTSTSLNRPRPEAVPRAEQRKEPAEEEEKEGLAAGVEAVGAREDQSPEVSTQETHMKTAGLNTAECDRTQLSQPAGPVDVEAVESVEDLEALGLDRLKAELMARGLKCGGTLAERAARLFSTRGLSPEQLDPALLAKPSKGKKK